MEHTVRRNGCKRNNNAEKQERKTKQPNKINHKQGSNDQLSGERAKTQNTNSTDATHKTKHIREEK